MSKNIMETKILKSTQTDEAVALLKSGDVIAIPTETVYGLAADAANDDALHKIFTAKGRPSDHPLIVHIDSFENIVHWVEEIPENARKLGKYFWPGPLTMVFRKRKTVSSLITGGLNTVAIRVPNHPIALEIIKKLGAGIAAPSANAHKKTSPTKPEHVLKTLEGKIAAIIDGGDCSVGIESTIIDMTREIPQILRPGAISAIMIENVLNIKVGQPFSHNKKISGNMKIHYQPEIPLFVMPKEEIELIIQEKHNVAVMHYSELDKSEKADFYKMPATKSEYARKLYETLYIIDSTKVNKIIVEKPPVSNDWADINDRLLKASSK